KAWNAAGTREIQNTNINTDEPSKDCESDGVTYNISLIIPFEIEANVSNMSNSTNIDEDLKEEARSYIESNWALFEQAIKRVNAKKSANNWRQVRAMIEWSRLVQMEKKMQATERQKHQKATWTSATKPYLMYMSYSDELNDSNNNASSNENVPFDNTDIVEENIRVYQESN
ncbi:9477_t:CDS:2, partial [Cetraspora pellucida]